VVRLIWLVSFPFGLTINHSVVVLVYLPMWKKLAKINEKGVKCATPRIKKSVMANV
jgi:hypothetical protein